MFIWIYLLKLSHNVFNVYHYVLSEFNRFETITILSMLLG